MMKLLVALFFGSTSAFQVGVTSVLKAQSTPLRSPAPTAMLADVPAQLALLPTTLIAEGGDDVTLLLSSGTLFAAIFLFAIVGARYSSGHLPAFPCQRNLRSEPTLSSCHPLLDPVAGTIVTNFGIMKK
jgi:hypothetical protein